MKLKLTENLYEQFMVNVEVTPGKCWLWKGNMMNSEYGSFRTGGVRYSAHRVAVTLFLDPNYDPTGRGCDYNADYVIHDCDTPLCVSPLCVKPGTASQNMQDAFARNRIDVEIVRKRMIGNQNSLGYKFTAEQRTNVSKALIGHKLSAETKAKISKAKTGRKATAKTRAKMSKSRIGNQNALGNRAWLGRYHTIESRVRMSESAKLRHLCEKQI